MPQEVVPPFTDKSTVVWPSQAIVTATDKPIADGCDTDLVCVFVQPLASVTVTVYIPAVRLTMSSVVAPFDHWKLKAGVPPVTLMLIEPLLPPLQETGSEVEVMFNAGGCEMVALIDLVQPLESVTVTVYVPAVRFVKSSEVAPLDHRKANPGVPPVTVRLIAPLLPPLQDTFVTDTLKRISGELTTVAHSVAVQPLLSVTVTQ